MNAVTRHGYTWQTALGNMGLNDMNGRVEDAIAGRFLSADPTIQNPGSTQNYNRYSYVNNNPLSLSDPTGFQYEHCINGCGGGAGKHFYKYGDGSQEQNQTILYGGGGSIGEGLQGTDATFDSLGIFNSSWGGLSPGSLEQYAGAAASQVTGALGASSSYDRGAGISTSSASANTGISSGVGNPDLPTVYVTGRGIGRWTAWFPSSLLNPNPVSWWNRPNTQSFCGLVCARTTGIPTTNTATNGQRVMGVVNVLSFPLLGVSSAADGAVVAARALTEVDLGLEAGAIQTLRGTYSVADGTATAQIDMIQGTISNPFAVIRSLSATAKADGAESLVIRGTLANERLFNIMSERYGMTSQGAIDTLTISLRGQ